MKKRISTPPVVIVEWYDSQSRDCWTSAPPLEDTIICVSSGFLVHDGPKAKTIAGSMTADGSQRACEITIPTCSIKSIRRLK